MGEKEQIMAVFAKARAFWEARILMTAAELDIFSHVLNHPKTANEVAAELSADLRGAEHLLDALAAMDLLIKQNGAYRVKPGLEKFLSGSAPETVLPLILHMAHLWENWGKLTDIVLKGKEAGREEMRERDEKSLQAFIGAMHTIGRGMAEEVISRLDLGNHEKMIDVGGGSGVYTIAALRRAPHLRATIFDRRPVIEIAEQKVVHENLPDRVELVKGDFYKDPLPGGHDLALLSAIIHQNSREQNVALYRKVNEALVPGGTIVIRDHVMNEDHTQPPDGAFFAINMLVNTPGGSTYSFSEIKEDLESAGFTGAQLVHHAQMDSLVTARKPK